ncbi:Multiprotein-bridging factor 1c [Dendrobium catenatum]|uniref:Multiprotein-bridging factor 1c n=1 Tax=Dendrobium catenatum TaxID=906689 RepID=A0A2I0VYJ3_9ASPA|nr:Multiprotein-bridging factor 1c [Dendrobium catenatum]
MSLKISSKIQQMVSELGIWRRIVRGLLVRNEDQVGFLIETVKKFDVGSNKKGSSIASQPAMNVRKLDE